MKSGLRSGATGDAVRRLQRVLLSADHEIDAGEIDRSEFGPSTLAALQAFQAKHSLKPTKSINAATLEILLRLEENITININESTKASPPVAESNRGTVHGQFVDEDGAPIAGAAIELVAKQIRTEAPLGKSTTDKNGQYSIAYARKTPLNLVARATDDAGKVIATSATFFAAPAQVEIDLTTAKDGIVRAPSQFTKLQTAVNAALGDTPLQSLEENKDHHDLQFLASSIGAPFARVAYLHIAHVLAPKNKLRDDTLYGLFASGIPANLNAALANLPDAGIDDAFTSQVLSGVLAQSRTALDKALTAAVASNILPASYSAVQEAQLSVLDALPSRR